MSRRRGSRSGRWSSTRGRVLLVNAYPGEESDLWCAPGGGAERGLSLDDNLRREVREETGLAVAPGRLLGVSEFHNPDDRLPPGRPPLSRPARRPGGRARCSRDPAGVVNRLRWVDAGELAAPLQARLPGAAGLRAGGAGRDYRQMQIARYLSLSASSVRRRGRFFDLVKFNVVSLYLQYSHSCVCMWTVEFYWRRRAQGRNGQCRSLGAPFRVLFRVVIRRKNSMSLLAPAAPLS